MKSMPNTKVDLLFHPIRMQLITAISNQQMTAKELAEVLPKIPLTTLYRHINALVEGGVMKIVGETQIRGTVERTYALAAWPSLKPEDLNGMTKQDCQQAFLIYLSSLMSAAQRYLESKGDNEEFNPLVDGVDLSLATLHLSDEEYQDLNRRILEILKPFTDNQPAPARKQRIFTYLFIPQ
jgi:DNA-binding transcriptional ArsR family regulator